MSAVMPSGAAPLLPQRLVVPVPSTIAVGAASALAGHADRAAAQAVVIAGLRHHAGLELLSRRHGAQMASAALRASAPVLAQLAVRRMLAAIRAMPLLPLHARLLQGARSVRGASDPHSAAAGLSDEPFIQFVVLALAGDHGSGAGHSSDSSAGSERDQLIALALAQLDEAHRVDIRARVHALAAAGELTPFGAAAVLDAGDGYAALVAHGESLQIVFRTLLTRFGARRFESMRRWLVATLVTDMLSAWASRERQVLIALRSHLHHAQSLGTMLDEASRTLKQVKKIGGRGADRERAGESANESGQELANGSDQESDRKSDQKSADEFGQELANAAAKDAGQDAVTLTGELLDLCEKPWIAALQLEQLADRYTSAALAVRLAWYHRVRVMLRAAPLVAHASDATRAQLLDAVQARYDALVDQEERNQGIQ